LTKKYQKIKKYGGNKMIFGALEAGGTKMVCALGKEDGTIVEQVSIPTTTPEETIPLIIDYFKDKDIAALGVGSFGPVDVNKESDTYGYILDTPKIPWKYYDLLGNIKKQLNVPVELDTDVNGSCLGEMTFGSSKGLDSVVYITIGTGVGVGGAVNGQLLHGMLHPEAGHILLRQHPEDTFEGSCPYHGPCLEGLAAGPAIEKRWGKKAVELKDNDKVWEMEAYYIAQALVNYILTLAPRRIILGGGVMHQEQLFPLIRIEVKRLLNGYLNTKEINDMEHYIVPASLNDDQGIMGCIQLAKIALQNIA
jgi:fructokinase